MTRIEKLTERLKNNPANVSFNDIRKLLTHEDFRLERVTGSHHIFKRGPIRFVIPVHNRRVKIIYVKRIIELIEGMKNEK